MIPEKREEYKFGASSCAETGTQSPVFDAMNAQNFDLFIQMGDIHYSGTNWSE